ncbi:hypothetical protein ACOMHN_011014 [Nucella lapillus]
MATDGQSSSSQPGDPMTSCPQCGSLCLGHSILSCGHVLCRRCLHDILQTQGPRAACPQCAHLLSPSRDRAPSLSQLVLQMGTDPVLEFLVLHELEKETNTPCLVCPDKVALNVCLECQEYYCQQCSDSHRKVRVSRDHVLCQLPQSLQLTPPVISAAPTHMRPLLGSASSLDSLHACEGPQPQDMSHAGAESVEWKKWTGKEVGLFQQVSSRHQEVENTLREIVSLTQQTVQRLHTHQHLVDTYQRQLTCFNGIQRSDPSSYVICAQNSDVTVDVKVEPLETRLRDVRKCHQCPDVAAVKMVKSQLCQLLQSTEPNGTPAASSVHPVMPGTTVSTHIPVSSPLSSPILPSVHTLNSPPFTLPPNPATQAPFLHLSLPPPGPFNNILTSPVLPSPTLSACPVFLPQPLHFLNPTCNGLTTTTPQRVFRSSARAAGDENLPGINATICLSGDRLVMSDFNNRKVKVVHVQSPDTVSAFLRVSEPPWNLALLPDGLVAVTTKKPVIYLLNVADSVTEATRIQTVRQYDGIAGNCEGSLIVSCLEGDSGSAAVDVLSREGQMLASFKHGSGLTVQIKTPHHLCQFTDHQVLLSDSGTHKMYTVDVITGQVTQTFHHSDLRYPRQMCVNNNGNVFVACVGSQCVLVMDRNGQCRKLLTGSLHSDPGYLWPVGVCLTSAGYLAVSWCKIGYPQESVVICYKLMVSGVFDESLGGLKDNSYFSPLRVPDTKVGVTRELTTMTRGPGNNSFFALE